MKIDLSYVIAAGVFLWILSLVPGIDVSHAGIAFAAAVIVFYTCRMLDRTVTIIHEQA